MVNVQWVVKGNRVVASFVSAVLLIIAVPVQAASWQLQNDLIQAATMGDVPGMEKAISAGADIEQSRALADAVGNGHMDAVKYLIAHGANPNGYHNDGDPLVRAAFANDEQMMSYLLAHGAVPDNESPTDSSAISTPLLQAIYYGKLDAARLLLKHGANPNRLSRTGNSALRQALTFTQGDPAAFVKLLLSYGADPDLKSGINPTARQMARARSNSDLFALMEAKKPSPRKPATAKPEYRYSLTAINANAVEKAMKMPPGSLHEVTPRSGPYYLEAKNMFAEAKCEFKREFVRVPNEARVLVAVCGEDAFGGNNLRDIMKAYEQAFAANAKPSDKTKIKLMTEHDMTNGMKNISILLPIFGHGIELIPTTVIIDAHTHTSFVVQIPVADEAMYDLDALREIGTKLYRLASRNTSGLGRARLGTATAVRGSPAPARAAKG